MTSFDRHSEKYSSHGSMSAQGFKRLLGTPTLDQLQTVIREAVQNSWDASSRSGRQPTFVVHLRQLSPKEMKAVREVIFNDYLPEENGNCLRGFLDQESPWVLELSDVGTGGLGGPTDASVVTSDGESSDFVDFVFNFGTPRDTPGGGGTYGYGKSSFYSLSKWGTIIVDSLAHYKGRDERRLIGSRVASSLVAESDGAAGKYTGRHWWGRLNQSGKGIDPVTGPLAETVSHKIGALPRGHSDYGTSIIILDPLMEESPEMVMNGIQRSLLWNFWPKLVTYPGKGQAMVFRTLLNQEEVQLPTLEECSPLNIFASAMRKLKGGEGTSIDCGRPRKHLGLLSIAKDVKTDRRPGFGPGEDGMFPETARHVALMRPAELVVKYVEGNLLPPVAEWGGVFVCSDDEEVENAFAQSEPPAHDDWIPDSLPRGKEKTFVRVALREIRLGMELVTNANRVNPEGQGAELAKLAGKMGALLTDVRGDALSPSRPGSRRNSSGRRVRGLRITGLEGFGPGEWKDGSVLAWFTFQVESLEPRGVILSGSPSVYIDGENADEAPDGSRPEVRVWLDENKELLGQGPSLLIDTASVKMVWVGITIPDESAVSFTPEIHE